MRNIIFLSFFSSLLFFSCRGQQQPSIPQGNKEQAAGQGAFNVFNKQPHRFELKGADLYYNGQQLKSDSLIQVYKIIGKPDFDDVDIIYFDKPIWINAYIAQLIENGEGVYLYDGKKVKYSVIKDVNPYEYKKLQERYPDSTLKGLVFQYSILMRRYNSHRITPDARDSMLMQIPELEGSVMVNGYPVNKDTPLDSLVKNLPRKGGWFGERVGIPTLVYDETTGHEFSDLAKTKKVRGVHINFLYMPDEKTGEEKLEGITYYIDLKK